MDVVRYVPARTTERGYQSPKLYGICEVCGEEFQGGSDEPNLCAQHREIQPMRVLLIYICPFCGAKIDEKPECLNCGAAFTVFGNIHDAYAVRAKR